MANKERRVVSHSWILGRKHTTTTKNYPLLRTPQHWMPGNGWRGWSRGVDAHEAAGGKRLVSAQGLESRRRERWGRRWSHKESKHPLTAEQQIPRLPGWLPGLSPGTCTTLCLRSSAPALHPAHSAPFTLSDGLV